MNTLRAVIIAPASRRIALLVALVLMESAVGAAWFVSLNRSTSAHSPLLAMAGIAGLIGLAHLSALLILKTSLTLKQQRLLLVGFLLLAVLLLTRFHVFRRFPLGDWGWLSELFTQWKDIFSRLTDAPIALALVLICWQRGLQLAYRELTLWTVSFSFRFQVLLLVGAGVLAGAGAQRILVLVYLYFFFGLLAMALARVDEIAAQREGATQPFGLGWATIVIGSAGLVIGLGWLFGRFYSPAGFSVLGAWLAPALVAFEGVVPILLDLFLVVVGPILEFIFNILSRLFAGVWSRFMEFQPPQGFPTPAPTPFAESETGAGIPWNEIARWGIIAALIVLGMLGVAFMLRRLRSRDTSATQAQGAVLPASEWADEILAGLREGLGRLSDALGALRRLGVGRGLYAALSIRAIYAALSRLAASRGYPRKPASTPYEYLSILQEAFAGRDDDLRRITAAYVNVRYGEVPTTMEELREIRQCWLRVRGQ